MKIFFGLWNGTVLNGKNSGWFGVSDSGTSKYLIKEELLGYVLITRCLILDSNPLWPFGWGSIRIFFIQFFNRNFVQLKGKVWLSWKSIFWMFSNSSIIDLRLQFSFWISQKYQFQPQPKQINFLLTHSAN